MLDLRLDFTLCVLGDLLLCSLGLWAWSARDVQRQVRYGGSIALK